jgi:hypothetical protein
LLWKCSRQSNNPSVMPLQVSCAEFPCEAGTYGPPGLCSSCPEEEPFSAARSTSVSACSACETAGTYSSLRECIDCELGHVNPLTNSTSSDACIPCESGKAPLSDRSSCSGCGAGSYSEGGNSTTAAVCMCACERSVLKAHEVRECMSSSSLLP